MRRYLLLLLALWGVAALIAMGESSDRTAQAEAETRDASLAAWAHLHPSERKHP